MSKYKDLFKKLTDKQLYEDTPTHFIWEVAEDKWVKVIFDRPYPMFDLEDVSWLFGYEYLTVLETFQHLADDDDYMNATFVTRDEGVYCTMLMPMLLSHVSVMDGMRDEEKAMEYVGAIGKIIEDIMPNGMAYLDVMTKLYWSIIKKAFGGK